MKSNHSTTPASTEQCKKSQSIQQTTVRGFSARGSKRFGMRAKRDLNNLWGTFRVGGLGGWGRVRRDWMGVINEVRVGYKVSVWTM